MLNIPLQAIPNQSFSFQFNNDNYDLDIHNYGNIMAVTVNINNVEIVSGLRAVPGELIIPYRYLENGNFTIVTADDEYPYWERFGIDQFLIYASQTELDAILAGA